jgi:hypothetical protein
MKLPLKSMNFYNLPFSTMYFHKINALQIYPQSHIARFFVVILF